MPSAPFKYTLATELSVKVAENALSEALIKSIETGGPVRVLLNGRPHCTVAWDGKPMPPKPVNLELKEGFQA